MYKKASDMKIGLIGCGAVVERLYVPAITLKTGEVAIDLSAEKVILYLKENGFLTA